MSLYSLGWKLTFSFPQPVPEDILLSQFLFKVLMLLLIPIENIKWNKIYSSLMSCGLNSKNIFGQSNECSLALSKRMYVHSNKKYNVFPGVHCGIKIALMTVARLKAMVSLNCPKFALLTVP